MYCNTFVKQNKELKQTLAVMFRGVRSTQLSDVLLEIVGHMGLDSYAKVVDLEVCDAITQVHRRRRRATYPPPATGCITAPHSPRPCAPRQHRFESGG